MKILLGAVGLFVAVLLIPSALATVNLEDTQMNLLESCLALDKTNENEYVLREYMCGHFTEDTCTGVNRCFRKYGSDLYMYPAAAHDSSSRSGWYHIVGTIEINGTWYIVEMMTDEVFEVDEFWGGYDTFFVARWVDNQPIGAKVRGVFKTLNG